MAEHEDKDEQEEEIHVPQGTADDVLHAVGLDALDIVSQEDSKPAATRDGSSLAYGRAQPQDGDVDIALPEGAEDAGMGWWEVTGHGGDGGQGDDGLVYTGYKGGVLVKANISAAVGSLEDEERAQAAQQGESQLFSALASRDHHNAQPEQNHRFLELAREADESDGLFFSGRNNRTYLGAAERSLGDTLQRAPMRQQCSREIGVDAALQAQTFRANMKAAAASLAEDGTAPIVAKDWTSDCPRAKMGCQQKPRRRSTVSAGTSSPVPVEDSPQPEPSSLVRQWHEPVTAVARSPDEELPQSEPSPLVKPWHQGTPPEEEVPQSKPPRLAGPWHQAGRCRGPKKPKRIAPAVDGIRTLEDWGQSEPHALVKPWHQPREYRRPDPATWEDIKANATLPKNPPPKCGQRSWEESRAAARSVLGYFPDDAERQYQPKETKDREVVSVITASDVFTNRQWLNHAGNLRYRKALSDSIDDYKTSDSECEKSKVAEQVMAIVEEKGGRFLRHEGSWQLLEDEAAKVFVLQSLRDLVTAKDSCPPPAMKPESEDERQRRSSGDCAPPTASDHPSSDDKQSNSIAEWEETGYDNTVIARAMRNYEAFHDLPRGAATVEGLRASSAGIEGWAAASTDGADNGTIWDVEAQPAAPPIRRAMARASGAWPQINATDMEAARQRDLEVARDQVVTIVEDNAKSHSIIQHTRKNDSSRSWVAGPIPVERYDDAVVEVALYNYECFYGLKPGTACVEFIRSTSAGIEGWAASVLSEEKDQQPSEETVATEGASADADEKGGTRRRKGDEEEARMLQIALLESVGARPPRGNCDLLSDGDSDEDSREDSDEDSEHDYEAHFSTNRKSKAEDHEDKKGCGEKHELASEEISGKEAATVAAADEKAGMSQLALMEQAGVWRPHSSEAAIHHTSSDDNSEGNNEAHVSIGSKEDVEDQEDREGYGWHAKTDSDAAMEDENSINFINQPVFVASQIGHPGELFSNHAPLSPEEIETMRDNMRILRSLCSRDTVELSALETLLKQCTDDCERIQLILTSDNPSIDLMELLELSELFLDAIQVGVEFTSALAAASPKSPPGLSTSVRAESAPEMVDFCAGAHKNIAATSPSEVSCGPKDKQELHGQPASVHASQPTPVAIPSVASDGCSADADGSWSQVSSASGSVSDGVLVEDDGAGSSCQSIEVGRSDSDWSEVSSNDIPDAD